MSFVPDESRPLPPPPTYYPNKSERNSWDITHDSSHFSNHTYSGSSHPHPPTYLPYTHPTSSGTSTPRAPYASYTQTQTEATTEELPRKRNKVGEKICCLIFALVLAAIFSGVAIMGVRRADERRKEQAEKGATTKGDGSVENSSWDGVLFVNDSN
jgi:hypothetical protein